MHMLEIMMIRKITLQIKQLGASCSNGSLEKLQN
jgi:hypothetical protein